MASNNCMMHGYGWEYTGDKDYKEAESESYDDNNKENKEFEFGEATVSSVGSNAVVEDAVDREALKKKVAVFLRKKKMDALVAAKKNRNKKENTKTTPKKEPKEEVVVESTSKKKASDCKLCDMIPCPMDEFYDDMMFLGAEMEEYCTHKQIRHALYRFMSNKIWGILGRHNRRELPKCVLAEIRDAYPAEKGIEYVGFKTAGEDTG
jgi:hypothetical protein